LTMSYIQRLRLLSENSENLTPIALSESSEKLMTIHQQVTRKMKMKDDKEIRKDYLLYEI